MVDRNAAARGELLEEFGYLPADEVRLGAVAVEWRGERLYLAFQFDEQGVPIETVSRVLAVLPTDRMSDSEAALWWTAGNSWQADGQST